MGLLDRLRADRRDGGGRELDLRGMVRDLLQGEIAAPTADVRHMIRLDTSPDEFYERELAPNWDGLGEDRRADKLDQFVELAHMVEASPGALPRDMAASLRTKLLVLGWAFDEEHGYLGRLA